MPGNKPQAFALCYAQEVRETDIPALPKSARTLIHRAIEGRLTTDPAHYGKPLRYSLRGHRRLRVADYRVIYRIDEAAHTVYIVAIKHRKDVYE